MPSPVDPEPSDAELVGAFQATRRPEVFDCLVRRHLERVNSMICRMGLCHDDADDLTQEVFLRAAKGLAGFREGAEFSTWLYRITMNVTRTFLRRRTQAAAGRALQAADPAERHSAAADECAADRERMDAIAQAMDALPLAFRAAIVLTAIHGASNSEAARIEGCSLPTMYWRVHKARKLLRERLRGMLE